MRVAALYDVHGNLPALEAVLADARLADVDLVVSGRDVAAGPFPRECLERLEALGDTVPAEEATRFFEGRRGA